jgi:carbamoyl-phosphate synthase large subunit
VSTTVNVLFLGGSKRVAVASSFVEAGRKYNRIVNIFSYELSEYEPIAQIGEIIIGKRWNDPDLLGHLQTVIGEKQINIVVPFIDIATIICSDLKILLPKVFFVASQKHANEIFIDKAKSNDWFVARGFRVPPFGSNALPLIAKPRRGNGAKGIFYLKDRVSFARFSQDEDINDFFVQGFVSGIEYSVDSYVNRFGQVTSVVPRKRMETINGEAVRTMTEKHIDITALAFQILSEPCFFGPVTIQFIVEKDTLLPYVLEINPRLGSGVVTSIHAGANICEYILADYLGLPVERNDDWIENLLMVRAYKEFYFHATNN